MDFQQFIGGSYESAAYTADEEKLVNLYVEVLQSQGATRRTVLYPTPGVESVSLQLSGNGRAHLAVGGREFAVIGFTFYEVMRDGSAISRGTVALSNNPATITSGGDLCDQLFITSGDRGYIYDLTANTLTLIPALSGKATQGGYLDGRFLCLDGKTSTLFCSALADGETWDPGSDFAQRSLAPDPWKAMAVVGRYIWLFGELTTEIWQDVGSLFPYAPFPGSLMSFGIAAPFSAVVIGNDVVWLGRAKTGRTCILKATGVTPTIISHYPLETALQDYIAVEQAVGDAYSDRGHTFYLLGIDSSNVTWCWDAETNLWHERGTWLSELNRYSSWRPRHYAYAFGEHRILDGSGGRIYRMSSDLALDVDARPIRRLRRAPAIISENERAYFSSFELILEPQGIVNPPHASFEMGAIASTLAVAFDYDPTGENPWNTLFTFTPTVTPGVAPYTYDWDWGDSHPNSTDEIPTHTFNDSMLGGTYHVTLTVTDAWGATATASANITVTGA